MKIPEENEDCPQCMYEKQPSKETCRACAEETGDEFDEEAWERFQQCKTEQDEELEHMEEC
ncbi:unnamed protein product [marine sediment metagenome]|uniref:Uncharacterized protein n=1 Tax=marine sediment metagenome TaxID=412755 RepID=X0WVM9_9ZZZZ